MAVAIALAACAAFCSALAVVLQRVALESAPTSNDLSPRLILHAVRNRGWLVGFMLMLCTFGFQATALRFGQLNVVQPVLTTELVFLVAILMIGFRRRVGRREVLGIAGIVIGLAGFFAAANPAVGKGQPDGTAWAVVGTVTMVGALVLAAAGRTGPRWWRATALGAAAAVLFADNAALIKAATSALRHESLLRLFATPDPYLIGLSGAVGLFLLQGALHAGADHGVADRERGRESAGEHCYRDDRVRRAAALRCGGGGIGRGGAGRAVRRDRGAWAISARDG